MTNSLKDDLIHLNTRLETIENQLSGQVKEIEARELKWKSMDEKADKIFNYQGDIIKFNVGGKKFATSLNTIKENSDTLFCKLIESGKIDIKEEIFFDRSPALFPCILNYLRTKQDSYKNLSKEELKILMDDAQYYQLNEIIQYLQERLKDISFVSFETSGPYVYNNQTAGNGKLEDLSNKTCLKGICANSPGWIIIQLNYEWDFEAIEIGGWKGNSTLWYSDNGAGASIMTSTDKVNWITVGIIPYGFGNGIQTVKLTKSTGRYIKFNGTSYVGLGYLKIKKLDNLLD
jgi:hypothetical protein